MTQHQTLIMVQHQIIKIIPTITVRDKERGITRSEKLYDSEYEFHLSDYNGSSDTIIQAEYELPLGRI
jgi:hypothetical protein